MSLYKSTMNAVSDVNEELIILLKKYIESFKKLVDNFKKKINDKLQEKDIFFTEYILLEDKILCIFESLQSSNCDNESIIPLIDEFNTNSVFYQNVWSEEYWKMYNYKRKIYEEKVLQTIKSNNFKSNKSILYGDITFDEVNEKEFLDNYSFMSTNNENFLLTSEMMGKSTKDESDFSVRRKCSALRKIDEELNYNTTVEIDFLHNKNKELSKNRSCLDCKIF